VEQRCWNEKGHSSMHSRRENTGNYWNFKAFSGLKMCFPSSSLPGGYVEKKRAFSAQKVLKSALFRHFCRLGRGRETVPSHDPVPATPGRILSRRHHALGLAGETEWARCPSHQGTAGSSFRPDRPPGGIGPPNPNAPRICHGNAATRPVRGWLDCTLPTVLWTRSFSVGGGLLCKVQSSCLFALELKPLFAYGCKQVAGTKAAQRTCSLHRTFPRRNQVRRMPCTEVFLSLSASSVR
jgi:hypothetical protein